MDEMIEEEFLLEEEFEKVLEEKEKKEQKGKKHATNNYQSHFIQKQIEINSMPETRLLNITKLFLFHFGLLDIRNSLESPNKVKF